MLFTQTFEEAIGNKFIKDNIRTLANALPELSQKRPNNAFSLFMTGKQADAGLRCLLATMLGGATAAVHYAPIRL